MQKTAKWIVGEADEVLETLNNVTYIGKDGKQAKGTVQVVKQSDDVGFRTIPKRKISYPNIKINGIGIERISHGWNGKVAIIGRKMSHVEQVAESLRKSGKEVEIFTSTGAFSGEGISSEALEEFDGLIKKYKELGQLVPDSEMKKSLMFKENKKWVNWLRDEGFDIYDIGNPGNAPTESVFFEMEKSVIFVD